MKCKKKVLLVVAVVFMIFLVNAADVKKAEEGELRFVDRIPHEDDGRIYFRFPPYLDVDGEGNIYAFCNNKHNFVFKIGPDGGLLKRIGQRGRGPGDLYMPIGIRVLADRFVVECSNGYSTFDFDGKFLYRFNPSGRTNGFDGKGDKIYLVLEGTKKLITVFSLEGEKLNAFGKRLKPKYSLFPRKGKASVNQFMNGGVIMCGPDRIFWFSRNFGDIRHYDYNGKLLHKDTLANYSKHFKDIAQMNREYFFKKGAKPDENIGAIQIVGDIFYFEGKFYVLTLEKKEYDLVTVWDCNTLEILEKNRIYFPGKERGVQFCSRILRVKRINGKIRYYFSALRWEDREPYVMIYE